LSLDPLIAKSHRSVVPLPEGCESTRLACPSASLALAPGQGFVASLSTLGKLVNAPGRGDDSSGT